MLKLPGVVKLAATADIGQTSTTMGPMTAMSALVSVSLAHWTTPNAVEQNENPAIKDARNLRHRARGKLKGVGGYKLSTQVMLAQRAESGPIVNGSGTGTGSSALLNPEHSRWLQGYPEMWTEFAPLETASSRKLPRRSSKRTSTSGVATSGEPPVSAQPGKPKTNVSNDDQPSPETKGSR